MIISGVIVNTYNIILYKTPYKNYNKKISTISELIGLFYFDIIIKNGIS